MQTSKELQAILQSLKAEKQDTEQKMKYLDVQIPYYAGLLAKTEEFEREQAAQKAGREKASQEISEKLKEI